MFHIQHQFEQVANSLVRRVQGAETRLIKQAQQMANTNLKDIVEQKLLNQQVLAEQREQALVYLAQDVKTLLGWFSHDVMALAGPPLAVRQDLFDFIVSELKQREDEHYPAIRKLRKGHGSEPCLKWAVFKPRPVFKPRRPDRTP